MHVSRIQRRPGSEREVRARHDCSLSGFQGRTTEKTKEASETNFYFAQTETLRQGLERGFRFPRPCRFVARRFVLASEFCISKPLSRNLSHSQSEPLPIIQILAIVVPESLLVKIAEKVERFDTYVGARDAALEQRPEIFQTVSVNASVNVLNGMIYDFVRVVACQSLIRKQGIG